MRRGARRAGRARAAPLPRRGARAGGALGLSGLIAGVSDELLASIARDEEELPGYARETGERNLREPYRRKLTSVWRRLDNDDGGDGGYADAAALRRRPRPDRPSLRAHGGARIADGRLAALRRRVEIFGFHLAKLDVRLHARDLATRPRRCARRSPRAPMRGRARPEALDT